MDITCRNAFTGKFVRLQKFRPMTNISSDYPLHFCEVVVPGNANLLEMIEVAIKESNRKCLKIDTFP